MTSTPDGVMNHSYALGRQDRPELIFRYKTRAMAAFDAAPLIRGGHLLDLGSADGLTLMELERLARPKSAIGVEYSQELVAQARQYGANVIQGDVEHLPEEILSARYNVITALALFEHLEDPLAALREVKRALIPGGTLVMSAPNPFWDNLAGKLGIHKEEAHHERGVTPQVVKGWASEAGFHFVTFRPFMFLPTAFMPYLKVSPPVSWACYLDNLLQRPNLAPLFVNQLFVLQKPV